MTDRIFEKYRKRLVREGIAKSLLASLVVGSGALALTELVSWFAGFRAGLWLGIGLFAGALLAGVPLFYFLKYRPGIKSIARRVDGLGLEERVITMVELENEETYIAQRQREDATKALGKVNHLMLKMAVSASLLVAVGVTAALGLGFTAVGSLHYAGVIPSGIDLLKGEHVPGEFKLKYSVRGKDTGVIVYWTDDWNDQKIVDEEIVVKEGEDAPAVLAVPADGWVFTSWSDGYTLPDGSVSPYRQDLAVTSNLSVTAVFSELDLSVDDDEQPPQEDEGDGDGNGNGNSLPGPTSGIVDVNMREDPSNQVHDGQTFYGDPFEEARRQAMERLSNDENIDEQTKGHVADYFASIEQSGEEEGEDGN